VKDDAIGFAAAAIAAESPGGRSGLPVFESSQLLSICSCVRLRAGYCCTRPLPPEVIGAAAASVALLSLIPGAKIVDLDAGCCGMAGSFGYTRQHYDVSVAIAERRLLPAVRKMERGDTLIATGTSCRHQVANSKARRPSIRPYLYVIFYT